MAPQKSSCDADNHRFFVAQRLLTERPTRAITIALCTACGEPKVHSLDLDGDVIFCGDERAPSSTQK